MRKNFGAKPITQPQPVFMIATYDADGTPNVMPAAWGGVSGAAEITIGLGSGHKTTENLRARGAFTVSMADEAHLVSCDYTGIVSGGEVPDKFARAGFTAEKAEFVDAPIIVELPVCVECRMKSYDEEAQRLVGEIVNVSVDESVLDAEGRVDVSKTAPVVFDSFARGYYGLGEKLGKAWREGKALM